MAYCTNCGHENSNEARFCGGCGRPMNQDGANSQGIVYDGVIHKCRNCGEILNSFVGNCPACGYELRGIKAVSSVREFAHKLEEIEKGRGKKRYRPVRDLLFGKAMTKTDEQKISLIRSFSIPNTKEDLYEFFILAKSNIQVDLYDSYTVRQNDARLELSEAWKAKFEQAYEKAKVIFSDDIRLREIDTIYNTTNKSIKQARWKTWKLLGSAYGIIFGVMFLLVVIISISSSNAERKEHKRLEAIVEEIEVAIEKKDYKYALMYADSLQYDSGYIDDSADCYWEIQREYWIDKVIEVAEKEGISLERPIEKSKEDDLSADEEGGSSSDYQTVSGNDSVLDSSLDSMYDFQQSIEEFNKQMEEIEDIFYGVDTEQTKGD